MYEINIIESKKACNKIKYTFTCIGLYYVKIVYLIFNFIPYFVMYLIIFTASFYKE